MDMRVQMEVLPPGVEHHQEADLGTQVLRIPCNREQGLRGSPKKEAVNLSFVLKRYRADLIRESKDHVEILDLQEMRRFLIKPFGSGRSLTFRAMPITARVIRELHVPAVVALAFMATKSGGATA